jgi:hypothetical protein
MGTNDIFYIMMRHETKEERITCWISARMGYGGARMFQRLEEMLYSYLVVMGLGSFRIPTPK